ncbi:unnamed protein product [Arabidopsis lyrata]|nr:unnamed protein product [Arabidopsis lyrata]
MLQHLWAGPISNASVDVVRGGQSVEVHAVGVTKGSAMERILGGIVHNKSMTKPIDYVLYSCALVVSWEKTKTFTHSSSLKLPRKPSRLLLRVVNPPRRYHRPSMTSRERITSP